MGALRGVATNVSFSIRKRLDGTLVTSGTVTVYITKDAGTQGTTSGTAVHEGNGQYTIALTATEMDAESIALLPSHADGTGPPITILTDRVISGTAQAGGASTITLATTPAMADSVPVGRSVSIIRGTGLGQERVITAFVESTRVATVDRAWTTQPDSTSVYVLFPSGADLRTINGGSTAGNNAELHLAQLNIVNSGGSAIVATSSGGNGHGMALTGFGTGDGLYSRAGATGEGIHAHGGATSGDGFKCEASLLGRGINAIAVGSNMSGIKAAGSTSTGSGIEASSTQGYGIWATGGTLGEGLRISGGTNQAGMRISGNGTGTGLAIFGGGTGLGVSVAGGSTSGDAISISATSGDGVSITAGGADTHGIVSTGAGTGHGMSLVAGGGSGSLSLNASVNAFTAAALAQFFSVDSGTTYASAVAGSVVKEIADNAGGGTPPTAADIADAVWDEARAGHVAAGSFGEGVASVQGSVSGNLGGNVGGSVGSVTGNVGGNVTGTIGGLTTAALAQFFTSDSGTTYASAVAGSVVKETADNASGGTPPSAADIADAVWDELRAGHVIAGSFGEGVVIDSIAANAITATSIASNAITAGKIATDAITAAKIASDAILEIQAGLSTLDAAGVRAAVGLAAADLDTQLAGLSTLDAAGVRAAVGLATANLDTQFGDLPTAGEIADAVWDEVQAGHVTPGTFGYYLDSAVSAVSTSGLTASDIADAVWDEIRADHTDPGTFGHGVASVQGNVTGSVASVTGAVASVTGGVGGNVTGSVGSLATQAKADVNAEVVDALATDLYDEPESVPLASASLAAKIGWLQVLARNKVVRTEEEQAVRDDADTVDVATATLTKTSTLYVRSEWVSA